MPTLHLHRMEGTGKELARRWAMVLFTSRLPLRPMSQAGSREGGCLSAISTDGCVLSRSPRDTRRGTGRGANETLGVLLVGTYLTGWDGNTLDHLSFKSGIATSTGPAKQPWRRRLGFIFLFLEFVGVEAMVEPAKPRIYLVPRIISCLQALSLCSKMIPLADNKIGEATCHGTAAGY